jgi:hypothetical protein
VLFTAFCKLTTTDATHFADQIFNKLLAVIAGNFPPRSFFFKQLDCFTYGGLGNHEIACCCQIPNSADNFFHLRSSLFQFPFNAITLLL